MRGGANLAIKNGGALPRRFFLYRGAAAQSVFSARLRKTQNAPFRLSPLRTEKADAHAQRAVHAGQLLVAQAARALAQAAFVQRADLL